MWEEGRWEALTLHSLLSPSQSPAQQPPVLGQEPLSHSRSMGLCAGRGPSRAGAGGQQGFGEIREAAVVAGRAGLKGSCGALSPGPRPLTWGCWCGIIQVA